MVQVKSPPGATTSGAQVTVSVTSAEQGTGSSSFSTQWPMLASSARQPGKLVVSNVASVLQEPLPMAALPAAASPPEPTK